MGGEGGEGVNGREGGEGVGEGVIPFSGYSVTCGSVSGAGKSHTPTALPSTGRPCHATLATAGTRLYRRHLFMAMRRRAFSPLGSGAVPRLYGRSLEATEQRLNHYGPSSSEPDNSCRFMAGNARLSPLARARPATESSTYCQSSVFQVSRVE